MHKSFDRWKENVDSILSDKLGLYSDDLEDWCWRAAYEDGTSEEQAVHEFLQDIEIPEDLIDEL